MELKKFNSTEREKKFSRNKVDLDTTVYGKLPPQARDLEGAVLGAIMLEKNAYENANEVLAPECFYVDSHQKIYSAMQTLAAKNQPIDLMTVVQQLSLDGNLERAGGPHAVTKLTNWVVSSANIYAHARIILQKYLAREIIRISGEVLNLGYEDTSDVFDLMDFAEEALSTLRSNNIREQYKTLQSVIIKNLARIEDMRKQDDPFTGVITGFPDLDKVTCGWQDTDLIILAARPSVGKTALALTLAKNATFSDKGTPVAIFSLEMSDRQLVDRMMARETGVPMWKLRNGKIDDEEMKTLYKGSVALDNAKIFIDQTAGISIQEFRSKCRMLKRKENIGLVIVDYLQLMTVAGKKMMREQEISQISRELKETAKELQLPVIALSQMSRDIEKFSKDAKREPQLSDLRESGAIEQDADMVMFLWRPTDSEIGEDAELKDNFFAKIAKHRNGTLEKFIGKFTGADQTHHYLNLVDNRTLQPMGSNWKPVKPDRDVVDFSQSKNSLDDYSFTQPNEEDMPF